MKPSQVAEQSQQNVQTPHANKKSEMGTDITTALCPKSCARSMGRLIHLTSSSTVAEELRALSESAIHPSSSTTMMEVCLEGNTGERCELGMNTVIVLYPSQFPQTGLRFLESAESQEIHGPSILSYSISLTAIDYGRQTHLSLHLSQEPIATTTSTRLL